MTIFRVPAKENKKRINEVGKFGSFLGLMWKSADTAVKYHSKLFPISTLRTCRAV